jgi:hypothetical protein
MAEIETRKDLPSDINIAGAIAQVNIEHVVYFFLIIVASILRIADLAITPLSPDEAKEALAVWNFWQPDVTVIDLGSPLYFSLTALSTQIFGFGDSSMRLIPVLFGIALVPLPWFLRHRIGRLGAIIASGLFALSPIHVVISRTAGGQSAAIFGGVLLFVAWLRYRESDDGRWFITAAAALAIGLISEPLFLGIAVALLVAWLVQGKLGPQILENQDEPYARFSLPEKSVLKKAALLFITVLILGATALLMNLQGMGASINLLTQWLRYFSVSGELVTLFEPILSLGRYEVILLLFGITASIWASWKGLSFPMFLVYWLIAALILTFLQRGIVVNLLILTIPGYLLVGAFVNNNVELPVDRYQVAITGAIFLLGFIFWVNVARYSRLITTPASTSYRYHLFIALATIALVGILLILSWNWDSQRTKQSVIISALCLLLVYTWGTTWWMSRSAANDTRERWVNEAADDDIYLLANAISEISWQVKNSATGLSIMSTIEAPALQWYLRDMSQFSIGSSIDQTVSLEALITSSDDELELENNYTGTTYSYGRPNSSHILDFWQGIRWWLFHESPMPINEEKLIFWLRSDLLGDGLE